MARDNMTLDEVIQFTKQALEKVNPDKRVHTEFRLTDVQVKQLLDWLEDYKQLKEDDNRSSGWIPCSKRVPEDGEEVLFVANPPWEKGKKTRVTMGRHLNKNGKSWWSAYYNFFPDYEVTHWMSLPELPKAENNA